MNDVADHFVPSVPAERVRTAVRDLLLAHESFHSLDETTRRDLAGGLVKICSAATSLEDEKRDAVAAIPQLARAQSAGSEFSGVAAQRVAGTTRDILNAVSFPRFVTELINGVFKAIVDSNQQQLHSYVELVRNVAASTDGFADANVGVGGARGWLAERFPETFVVEGADDFDEPPEDEEERAERAANARLRLRPGATMPSPAALRLILGLPDDQSVPAGDPESLVPIARVAMARGRQQMLATMVMLGLQRLVIDSGRLHASMRFHIDTRSAAQDDRASQFDARHSSTVSGSFGYGPWGASATMTNTIGYVSTQKTQTTEEMNTDLNLDSSVELVFKTDYLPLERLAGGAQLERIKVNTLNPEAEAKAVSEARKARDTATRASEEKRSEGITKGWPSAPSAPPPVKPGERGSSEDAEKARLDAAKQDKDKNKKKSEEEKKTELSKKTDAPAKAGPPAKVDPAKQTVQSKSSKAGTLAAPLAVVPRVKPDVIFAPTPPESVEAILQLAQPSPGQTLIDLGCGDGRIIVAAAERYGCHAVGYDIDPERVAETQARINASGVRNLVRVERRDLFTVDVSTADVVILYLLPHLNVRLMPQLQMLRPGARVVSHDFEIQGVIPDRVVQDYLPRLNLYKTYFLFTAPLRLAAAPVSHEWSESSRLALP